jgi:DNA-binding ferritin-like protein (Dps family)
VIGPKRRWWAYKARVGELPPNHRTAVDAIERYLMFFVPTDSDSAVSQFEDPVEFVEAFVQNYTKGGYVPDRERDRLTDAIARAEEEQSR